MTTDNTIDTMLAAIAYYKTREQCTLEMIEEEKSKDAEASFSYLCRLRSGLSLYRQMLRTTRRQLHALLRSQNNDPSVVVNVRMLEERWSQRQSEREAQMNSQASAME
jgi:hypothetical protein